uniref:Bbp19-like phage domain-containing protein n=1 Tax=viral metagenome TaxID=1070528 RepID=A0A6H2A1G9_9ZZZZ
MDDKEQIEKLQALKTDYINTFSSENGKKVLEDLEKRCFIKTTAFANTDRDTNFNLGMQAIILHIKSMIDLDIERIKKRQEDADAG